jgi:acetyl esterase/lipase
MASDAAENGEPVYGVVAFVPLINTNPNPRGMPWGLVEDSPGLPPEKLLGSLNATFKYTKSRDHWRKNPSRWSDSRLGTLPRMVIGIARHDILRPQTLDFGQRMLAQGANISYICVDGIHQVKDMDQITKAGQQIRKFMLNWCRVWCIGAVERFSHWSTVTHDHGAHVVWMEPCTVGELTEHQRLDVS